MLSPEDTLLSAITSKKKTLKPTEITIKYPNGETYKATNSNTLNLVTTRNNPGYVIDTKPDNIPSKVTDFIYLGSQDCCDIDTLTEHDIKNVLSVGIEAPTKHAGVNYKFVRCLDLPETDLDGCIEECVPFIENSEKNSCKILVHCNAGVSRSSSVVIAYLMLMRNLSYVDAFDIVKSARSCIKPNAGFEVQLRRLGR